MKCTIDGCDREATFSCTNAPNTCALHRSACCQPISTAATTSLLASVADATVVLLGRTVRGHLVPQLALVRVGAREISSYESAAWKSGVGRAVVLRDARNGEPQYMVPRQSRSRTAGFESELLRIAEEFRVPALYVNEADWDETWIELIDIDGYVALSADARALLHGHMARVQ